MKRAMIRKRHRPEEIVAKLRETDEALAQGKSPEDVAKSLGVSLMTLHRWRTEYGSTDRDAVKRLKELERENGRLKRLVEGSSTRYPDLERGGFYFKFSGVTTGVGAQSRAIPCPRLSDRADVRATESGPSRSLGSSIHR